MVLAFCQDLEITEALLVLFADYSVPGKIKVGVDGLHPWERVEKSLNARELRC